MISTPCTGICMLDGQARRCVGCGRTLDQIAAWGTLSEAQRQAIMRALAGDNPQQSLHAAPVPR